MKLDKELILSSLVSKRYFENTVIPRKNSAFVCFTMLIDCHQASLYTFTRPQKNNDPDTASFASKDVAVPQSHFMSNREKSSG